MAELFSSACSGNAPIRRDRMLAVVRDAEAFRIAVEETVPLYIQNPGTELPAVDFERFVVVEAHAGYRGCGPSIAVTAVRDTGPTVEVEVTDRYTCIVDTADSWPYAFARVPRLDKPYVLVEKEQRPVCEYDQSCGCYRESYE